MIDPDKELPLGDIDQIDLDEDPRRYAARRKAREIAQEQAKSKKPAANKRPAKKPKPQKAATKSSGRGVLIALIVCFVLLLGLAGWSVNRIDQLQAQLVAQQQAAAKQLQQLQGRISATGDTASESRDKLSDTLAALHKDVASLDKTQEKHAKELRRLSANDRQTRQRVGDLEDQAGSVQNKVAALADELDSIDALQKTVKAQKKAQKLAALSMSQLQMQQDLNAAQVKELTDNLAANQEQMDALKAAPEQLDALQKQLDEVQAAISAFDKWRLQVNQKLRQSQSAPAASSSGKPISG